MLTHDILHVLPSGFRLIAIAYVHPAHFVQSRVSLRLDQLQDFIEFLQSVHSCHVLAHDSFTILSAVH